MHGWLGADVQITLIDRPMPEYNTFLTEPILAYDGHSRSI